MNSILPPWYVYQVTGQRGSFDVTVLALWRVRPYTGSAQSQVSIQALAQLRRFDRTNPKECKQQQLRQWWLRGHDCAWWVWLIRLNRDRVDLESTTLNYFATTCCKCPILATNYDFYLSSARLDLWFEGLLPWLPLDQSLMIGCRRGGTLSRSIGSCRPVKRRNANSP